MIILGVILPIIGFVAKVAIIWTLGIIVVMVGVVMALLCFARHAADGRRHCYRATSYGLWRPVRWGAAGGRPGYRTLRAHHHCAGSSPASEQLLVAECSLRARRKARSLKVLLRTPVAASAILSDAYRRVPELFSCTDVCRRAPHPQKRHESQRQNSRSVVICQQ